MPRAGQIVAVSRTHQGALVPGAIGDGAASRAGAHDSQSPPSQSNAAHARSGDPMAPASQQPSPTPPGATHRPAQSRTPPASHAAPGAQWQAQASP